ncbi:GNAT family N-acetyltransferase [Natranaerobius thermophilus]|uniref:GCN5-related N-acetyltransferase n=1 Tax=Natranaerobius thermophilus (strain ATCC BAA-1301 / DSM 18059 / JW/NM-WN-LF) TaxID=457570 RepID=B2A4W2_NATTJ|nr:GNAT family N-acetyltransferase [Natranaerobius thermophilus]ACB83884.1 GCN5-related N-acetyltransferase [Natranaerobius thermophilus JW/NM-WN-LF]
MKKKIRQGKISDFSRLSWAWDNNPSTLKVFKQRMNMGIQEFWVIESLEKDNNGNLPVELAGEFHIVWDSPDPDEADGEARAYLCAFRVHPDYRGLGLGKNLMEGVLSRVSQVGRTQVTIGVKQNRPEIKEIYHKWGFTELVKLKTVDHHNFNEQGEPNPTDFPIELYLKYLSKNNKN